MLWNLRRVWEAAYIQPVTHSPGAVVPEGGDGIHDDRRRLFITLRRAALSSIREYST